MWGEKRVWVGFYGGWRAGLCVTYLFISDLADMQDFACPIFSFQTWLMCRILHVPSFHLKPGWCAGFCMSQLFIWNLADVQDFACPSFSFETWLMCRILHVPAFHLRPGWCAGFCMSQLFISDLTICHFAWGRQTKFEDYFLELFSKTSYKTATPFPWHRNLLWMVRKTFCWWTGGSHRWVWWIFTALHDVIGKSYVWSLWSSVSLHKGCMLNSLLLFSSS